MSGFGILPDIALSSAADRGLSGVIIGDEKIITIELRPHLLIIDQARAVSERNRGRLRMMRLSSSVPPSSVHPPPQHG